MNKNENINKLTLKKNDQVQVIAGREKGKVGKLLSIDRSNFQVIVEKTNLVKRHTRPTQKNPAGGITEKEAPLHYSNVLLYCQKCNRGVRHGVKVGTLAQAKGKKREVESEGKKIRFCKKCNSPLEST